MTRPDRIVVRHPLTWDSLNTPVMCMQPLPPPAGGDWCEEMPIYGYKGYEKALVLKTLARHKLAYFIPAHHQLGENGEFDYSFFHLSGKVDGAGLMIKQGYPSPPANPRDAYGMLQRFIQLQYLEPQKGRPFWRTMPGHYLLNHAGVEAVQQAYPGLDFITSSEVGENIMSINAHVAFTRGSGRQYGLPWGLQMSPWYGHSIRDYSKKHKVWSDASDPQWGHSLSLFRRVYHLTYLAGAQHLVLEGASVNFFHDEQESDGTLKLSPLGEIGKAFYAFSHSGIDRGLPYTPIALVFDKYHGMDMSGPLSNRKRWAVWPYRAPDLMNWHLLNTLWPDSLDVMQKDESQYLVNTPYGELYDALVDDAPLTVMANYRVLWLTGDIALSADLTERLTAYVRGGGTLVVNAAQLNNRMSPEVTGLVVMPGTGTVATLDVMDMFSRTQLEGNKAKVEVCNVEMRQAVSLLCARDGSRSTPLATLSRYGKGTVVVTTPVYCRDRLVLDYLLRRLNREVMPFTVEGDVQYLLNRTRKGWLVTLVNNKGVTKSCRQPDQVDETRKAVCRLVWPGGKRPTVVRELLTGMALAIDGSTCEVTVPSGDVRAVDITMP